MVNLSFLGGFDASQIEDTFELIPPGEYDAQITDSEMVENKNHSGEYLKLEITLLSNGYEGRKLFDRLNLIHANEKAADIAQKQFANICKAVGILTPQDSTELYERPLVVVVDIDGEYNRIKRYKAVIAEESTPTPGKKARKPKAKKSDDIPGLSPDTGKDPDDDLPF